MAKARNNLLDEMMQRSVIKALKVDFTELSGVWLASQDFDHDEIISGSPPVISTRLLPYVVLRKMGQRMFPYEVNNIRIEYILDVSLIVACRDVFEYQNLPSQIQQFFYTNTVNDYPGRIILWNYGVSPEVNAGYIDTMVGDEVVHYPEIYLDKKTWKNLKFAGVVPLTCQVVKIKENSLL